MSDYKVTLNMIDDELTDTIWENITTRPIEMIDISATLGGRSYNPKDIIRATLAYLTNHPIEMTEERAKKMADDWQRKSAHYPETFWPTMLTEYQRTCFLKKDAFVPDDIRRLLWKRPEGQVTFAGSTADSHNAAVVEAYKIGLEEGKKA